MRLLPQHVKVARVASALPLLAVGMLIVWLVLPRDASASLEPGEPFPRVQFEVIRGRTPGADAGGRDVVVFFRPNCEACRIQLDMLERSVINLRDARLYLIGASPAAEIRSYMLGYPLLAEAQGVSWASIGAADAQQLFGVERTPTIIVFDNLRVTWVTMRTATLASILDHSNSTSGRLDRTARARPDRSLRNRSAEKCGSCEVEQDPNGRRP